MVSAQAGCGLELRRIASDGCRVNAEAPTSAGAHVGCFMLGLLFE